MRWYGQLAVIAVLGGAGYGGWHAYQTGQLARLPGVGPMVAAYLPSPAAAPAGGAAAPRGRGAGGPPPIVEVDAVKAGRVIETREAVGTVRALESIMVTAKVAGVVDRIGFQEGQRINTGDVLIEFDAMERRADIEQAEAEARRAVALRDEIRTRLDRAQELRRSGSGAAAQVEDLTAQVKTLDSAIAAAEARRRATEARLDDLVVRAPFAGRLGTRSVSLGAYVPPGTRITTLDDLSKVRLDFSVPENLLAKLQAGQTVRARSAAFGERSFEGKVSIIDPRVDPVTRTVKLTADFENPDEALRPGMFLSVALEVEVKTDAVVAPEEAVVSEGLRHVVFLVKDDKTVERRVVRIGQRQDGRVEIVEGLALGETLVVRGVQRVRAGLAVTPQPLGGAPAAEVPPATAPRASTTGGSLAPAPLGAANAAERRG